MSKTCRRCLEEKSEEFFNYHNKTPDNLYPICKTCRRRKVREDREVDLFKYLCIRKRSECKARGLDFNLTPEYLKSIWTGICPVRGVKLETFKRYSDDNYALDRINPALGYIQGNVAFISNKANRMKNDNSPDDLRRLLRYVEKSFNPSKVWSEVNVSGDLLETIKEKRDVYD